MTTVTRTVPGYITGTWDIMQSIRHDLGYGSQVDP
jgi:hypothetical protein